MTMQCRFIRRTFQPMKLWIVFFADELCYKQRNDGIENISSQYHRFVNNNSLYLKK